MPEGDSLFRFARKIAPVLEGETILAARAHGPGPVPRVEMVVGQRCVGVRSQGKNILISFENGLVIRGHLRMYGTWHVYARGEPWRKPEREARLVIETSKGVVVNFSAPVVEMLEERALGHYRPIAGLGDDLLAPGFDAEAAFARFRAPERARLTIGDGIMDQRVMAGVGNIWKHETLFRLGMNPWREVGELTDAELRAVISTARELLNQSVTGRRPKMMVYGRGGMPCFRCYTRLLRARQGVDLRFTAWCPACQPEVEGQRTTAPRTARVRSG